MSKFRGKNTHRFSTNPIEKVFSDLWAEENERWIKNGLRGSVLQYILSEDGGKTVPETSERDEMITASVIQWLATPIGKNFLEELHDTMQKEKPFEKEMREVTEQFERLWKKHGLSKKAYSDEEIAPFKYVALKWYMRGRFNE